MTPLLIYNLLMKSGVLILRGLTYYWRTNAAVVIGVATAVAVLSGALLVGDSVRGSLRDMVLQRLGRTDHLIASSSFVREQLGAGIEAQPGFGDVFDGISPIIVTQGFVTAQSGTGRAGQVKVYGVGSRFWSFHQLNTVTPPADRDALISPALARELGVESGGTILIRVQRPSAIPLESLHGRKDELGQTIRATVREVMPAETLGEFSLDAQQGDVRAVFVPLARLQQDLDVAGKVNAFLVSAKSANANDGTARLAQLVRNEASLEDLGLKVRAVEARNEIAVETDAGVLDDSKAAAASEVAAGMGLESQPVFTYLVNNISHGVLSVPYSLVTAMHLPSAIDSQSIVLNDWAASELGAGIGSVLTLEYYVWEEPGRLVTRSSEFRVADVIPINARERDLVPVYPGITEATTLGDWNPPFPIDLRRIRPIDEEYWEFYRTTPKAFIPIATGQELWKSRYGSMTSIRIAPQADQPLETVRQEYAQRLREKLDPLSGGLAVTDVRRKALEASRGATDFGEYFVYFSFFLVVSALLLAALFFKLSVEQRSREIGLLRAVGFGPAAVRRLFVSEGFLLSIAGAVAGTIGGLGYAWLMLAGLRTWWVDAVGTTAITLHIVPASLAGGAIGGIAAATFCIWLTLRSLAGVPERSLLAGELTAEHMGNRKGHRSVAAAAIVFALIGAALLAGTAQQFIESAAAFFGAGSALLAACLCFFVFHFRRSDRKPIEARGRWAVSRLGLRNAKYRPARSVLSIAMIASATFILISVDAFRKGDGTAGTGGYSLLVESLLPVVQDPASPEARQLLGLAEFDSVRVDPFRVRPGDDTSCLNLYEPTNPRIIAPTDTFIAAGRFAFKDSLAANETERANPWLLLHRNEPGGAVPVIADANSMTYVLHRKLGDEMVITVDGAPLRLRLVAALDDSIFQGELLMSQSNFLKLFPEREGYPLLLVDAPPERRPRVAAAIESALADFGADVTPAAQRLAEFHRVENTYLSTFQMLGGLGLLLGTVGLGAVMLRNIMERRRELALLRALGYRQTHIFAIVIAENVLLLVSGLVTGAACAFLAIAPVLMDRGGNLPALSLAALLAAVLVAGLVVSLAATIAAIRSPLLAGLHTE